jgi:hypothetical protein
MRAADRQQPLTLFNHMLANEAFDHVNPGHGFGRMDAPALGAFGAWLIEFNDLRV